MLICQLNEAIEVIDQMTWDVKNGTWSVNQFDHVRDLVDSLEATRDALAELRYIREENDPADRPLSSWEQWASENARAWGAVNGNDEPCSEDEDDCA